MIYIILNMHALIHKHAFSKFWKMLRLSIPSKIAIKYLNYTLTNNMLASV